MRNNRKAREGETEPFSFIQAYPVLQSLDLYVFNTYTYCLILLGIYFSFFIVLLILFLSFYVHSVVMQ